MPPIHKLAFYSISLLDHHLLHNHLLAVCEYKRGI